MPPTFVHLNGSINLPDTETVFRGEEAEVFVIRDGPQQADGYTWWYLVAPNAETRAGWAAADFLAVVPGP